MDGDEHHVVVLVHEFHHFVDATLVVGHLHQTAEHTHAMVDMDDVIADVEGAQIIERKLFRLLHRPAETYPVEAVEYFMVGITANLVLIVDETRMDDFPLHEFRKERVLVLQDDGSEPFQLRFLLPEYLNLVPVFHPGPDIRKQQFEVLVENRLRRDIEGDAFLVLAGQRNIQIHVAEIRQLQEKVPVPVHVGRIQPYRRILFQECQDAHTAFLRIPGDDVRIDIGLVHDFLGQLGIAVEGMDLLHLISEEGQAVGIFQGIGENVDDRTADGILPRGRYEVHTLEPLVSKDFLYFFVTDFLAGPDGEKRIGKFLFLRDEFFQRFRIGDDEKGILPRIHDLADGSRPLDAQGRLVIAPFHGAAAVWEEEDAVALDQVV